MYQLGLTRVTQDFLALPVVPRVDMIEVGTASIKNKLNTKWRKADLLHMFMRMGSCIQISSDALQI